MAYVLNNLIALDQLANTVLGGSPDETLSARAYRTEQQGKLLGRVFRPLIDRVFGWFGNTLSVSTELAGYHSNATDGIITRTAAGTITGRTLSTSGSGISVANGNGIAGNPTFSLSAALSSIGGLTPSADRLAYFTTGGADLAVFTAFARTLLDDADAATMRTTLGLGTVATQASSNINITGGSITGLTTFDNITIDCGTY